MFLEPGGTTDQPRQKCSTLYIHQAVITRDDALAKCLLHQLPLSPSAIAIWGKGNHVLATAELARHDEVGFVAVHRTALIEEVEDDFWGVEEDEGLGKNADVGDVSICASPFEGGEPELCDGEIQYVTYDGKGLWTRWKWVTGGFAFSVPICKQCEDDEGHGEEHCCEMDGDGRLVNVSTPEFRVDSFFSTFLDFARHGNHAIYGFRYDQLAKFSFIECQVRVLLKFRPRARLNCCHIRQ